jgi:EmrB/QacA subfamily drug resistance transporter
VHRHRRLGRSNNESAAYSRRWQILTVLCLSVFVVVLDDMIINVTLPVLQRELHASVSQLQWIMDGYLLVFAGFLLTAGSFGDRRGRKYALQLGVAVFGAGSLASAFAVSVPHLLAARALMGLGAAFIMPTTLSILTSVFPEGERTRAIATWSAVVGVGVGVGPLIGGLMLRSFSWGSVFLLNVPICGAVFLATAWLIDETRDEQAHPSDVPGALLSSIGVGVLLWAVIEAPQEGWFSPRTLAAAGAAIVLLFAFARWEQRAAHPMLDLHLFREKRFSAAVGVLMAMFFALTGLLFLLTQLLQLGLGYVPFESGLRTSPVSLAIIVGAFISGRIAARVEGKRIVVTGLLVITAGLVVIAPFGILEYPRLLVGMMLVGFGMGVAMAPATETVLSCLPPAKVGVGSAVNDVARQIGAALGVAVSGSVFASCYRAVLGGSLSASGFDPAASDSLARALQHAAAVGGDDGAFLAAAARSAFLTASAFGILATAAICLAGAMVGFCLLPSQARGSAHRDNDSRLEPSTLEPENGKVGTRARAY